MHEVIFDVETKSFFTEGGARKPEELGVSIVSLYRRELDSNLSQNHGELLSFWEGQFPDMWKIFLDADRIIGFNSLTFDIPALKPYSPANFAKLPHFDILDKIKELEGRRVSLNRLAQLTLGRGKSDAGENAMIYWQKNDPESLAKLKKYCEADVLLTRDLYDFGLKNKYLQYIDFWNNPRRIEIDFSYPQTAPKVQTALF
jgi:uncharacterized protein YprB with RNaseH-like and TPR domain